MQPFGITVSGDKTRVLERIQDKKIEGDAGVQAMCDLLIKKVTEIPPDAEISLSFAINLRYTIETSAGPREVGA